MEKEFSVKAKYLRISPKKVFPYLMKLKNQPASHASNILKITNKKYAKLINKLLQSGIAAAKEQGVDQDKLIIKQIVCNQGPIIKRRLIGSKGGADLIKKRTCHFELTLSYQVKKKNKKTSQPKKSGEVKSNGKKNKSN